MLRNLLIIIAAIVLLKLIIGMVGWIRGSRDADLAVDVQGNEVLVTHSGEVLSNAVLTINGNHEMELGTVPSGTHSYTIDTSEPLTRVDLLAFRNGRSVGVHHMYVTARQGR